MDSIIVTKLNEITLKSGLLKIETSKGDLLLDIKQMMREPVDSENAYFNATRVASFFSRGKELNKFMNLNSTKEYIKMLNDEFIDYTKKGVIKNRLKTHFVKRGRETEENKGTFGTYLHNELFFEYLGWCDVKFRREIHKLMKEIITHSNEIKIERSNTKIHFKPLTQAIKDIYIPNQESESAKRFAYQNIATLINMKALGMSGTKYRKDNNIDDEIDLRDVLDKDTLERIDEVEMDLYGYIKYANITDYEILKEKIQG